MSESETRFYDYRRQSRLIWGKDLNSSGRLTDGDLQLGAVLRIADALEGVVGKLERLLVAVHNLDPTVRQKRDEAERLLQEMNAARQQREQIAQMDIVNRVPCGPPEAMVTPLESLPWSTRCRNLILGQMNLATVGDLARRTADELLEERNFGSGSLVEVRQRLGALGVSLAGDDPIPPRGDTPVQGVG